jgi:hypothetical protein
VKRTEPEDSIVWWLLHDNCSGLESVRGNILYK